MNKKPEKMKARGIRMTQEQWTLVCRTAKADKMTPSAVVRIAVINYLNEVWHDRKNQH